MSITSEGNWRGMTTSFDEDLSFNPWHDSQTLRPVGFLNALRNAAYRGSQSAR
jgi:hypothetical protein